MTEKITNVIHTTTLLNLINLIRSYKTFNDRLGYNSLNIIDHTDFVNNSFHIGRLTIQMKAVASYQIFISNFLVDTNQTMVYLHISNFMLNDLTEKERVILIICKQIYLIGYTYDRKKGEEDKFLKDCFEAIVEEMHQLGYETKYLIFPKYYE